MCRIAGIVSRQMEAGALQQQVQRMCMALRAGGPDDGGVYLDAQHGVCLGHRRLSIIDLTVGGHQPMHLSQPTLWISFNGEIYNYRELRQLLMRAGRSFSTASDTEVILQAYATWGLAAFEKLNGMFAFALYDQRQGQLWLVRDPSGIKPLYYSLEGGHLVFASAIKAFRHTSLSWQTNTRWPPLLLAYGHIPAPYTTLQNVYSLPKGNYLQYQVTDGSAHLHPYYHFQFTECIQDAAEAKVQVREALQQAVKRHLIADAPIGIFLSGGIDSSLLAMLAAQFQRDALRTVSVNFSEKGFSEKQYQDLVVQQLHCRHSVCQISRHDFLQDFNQAMDAMDQPSTDGLNIWFISRYARATGLKAVLSGLGADELFGGYPSFRRMHALRRLRQVPQGIRRSMACIPGAQWQRLDHLEHAGIAADYLFLRGIFPANLIAPLLNMDEREVVSIIYTPVPAAEEVSTLSELNRTSWLETNYYLQNQLLKDTDAMSMAHGLEVRVPFLDKDFLQTVYAVPDQTRCGSKPPKGFLIQTFQHLLQRELWDRPKRGFTLPLQIWMKELEELPTLLQDDNKLVRRITDDFLRDEEHWSRMFSLYLIKNYV